MPSGPSLVAGDGQVELGLPIVQSGTPPVIAWNYRLQYDDDGTCKRGEWTPVPDSLVIDGLANDRQYWISMQAVNRLGASSYSHAVSTTPSGATLAAPSGFRAVPGSGQVILRWDETQDAGVTNYQYRYLSYEPQQHSSARSNWRSLPLANEHAVSARFGVRYLFDVRAVNSEGPGAISSGSAIPELMERPSLPPTGFSATWPRANEVELQWDVENPWTRYEYRYSEDDGASWADWQEAMLACNSEICNDTVPVSGSPEAYRFELRRRANLNADVAAARTGSHPLAPHSPAIAQIVTDDPADPTSWELRWSASAEGQAAAGWQYRFVNLRVSGGSLWSEWTDMQPAMVGSTYRFTVARPEDAPLEQRMFQVRGTNTFGFGAQSASK